MQQIVPMIREGQSLDLLALFWVYRAVIGVSCAIALPYMSPLCIQNYAWTVSHLMHSGGIGLGTKIECYGRLGKGD